MKEQSNMKKGVMNNFIYVDASPCQVRTRQYYKSGEIKRIIRENRQKELRRK